MGWKKKFGELIKNGTPVTLTEEETAEFHKDFSDLFETSREQIRIDRQVNVCNLDMVMD